MLNKIGSLHISKDGIELARQQASPSATAFAIQGAQKPVQFKSLANRAIQLSWDATKYPVLMIRDTRTGEVRGFVRGGTATLTEAPDEIEVHYSTGPVGSSLHFQQ
jgi:hypothetical protein